MIEEPIPADVIQPTDEDDEPPLPDTDPVPTEEEPA